MTHDRLSDYEIAINFGDTLQIIYKEKMAELNKELEGYYSTIDRISIPQVPQWQRDIAIASRPAQDHRNIKAVEHINKIRGIYKRIKSGKEFIDVEKARNTPITKVYDFKRKGQNVSCIWHEDKNPSASIKFNRLICFSCGCKDDVINVVMKLNNINFKEAVNYLNKL